MCIPYLSYSANTTTDLAYPTFQFLYKSFPLYNFDSIFLH